MPDVLEMLQNNPEMAQSLTSQATPDSNVIPLGTPQAAAMAAPAWQTMRAGRTHGALSNPNLQGSLAMHHQAVADASALNHQAQQEFSLLHAAHTLHDTGAYYQEAHGIRADDPNYEDKMVGLAVKYPYARPESALMQPLHESRKTYLEANSIVQQRQQEQHVYDAVGKGLLNTNDFQNPQFLHQDGSPNIPALRMLAAMRESGAEPGKVGTPNLNETERGLLKTYGVMSNSPEYQKLFKRAQAGDPQATTMHNAYWNTMKKMGYAPAGAATGAPVSATAPVQKQSAADIQSLTSGL